MNTSSNPSRNECGAFPLLEKAKSGSLKSEELRASNVFTIFYILGKEIMDKDKNGCRKPMITQNTTLFLFFLRVKFAVSTQTTKPSRRRFASFVPDVHVSSSGAQLVRILLGPWLSGSRSFLPDQLL